MNAKAYYRKAKIGLPKTVTFTLTDNTVILLDTDSKTIIQANLSELTSFGQGLGFIAFKHGDDYYSLEFIEPWKKLLGVFGIYILGKNGIQKAKDLRSLIESKGIKVNNQKV